MCLSVDQDLAYIIHRSLNRVDLPFFFSLGNKNRVDHISGGQDVEEECFLWTGVVMIGSEVKNSLRASKA
jgi:hypothetical protein